MFAADRFMRATGMIRAAGILVMLLVVLGGAPQVVCGEFGCETYRAQTCITGSECQDYVEDDCGNQLPGCEDEGWFACAQMSGCEGSGDYALVCQFEEM